MHTVVTTPTFDRQAHQAGWSEHDVAEMVSWIAANVTAGDLIVGTGGARKVRFARSGSGKSGGYRTIHYSGGEDIPVFLLAVVDKGKRANLSMPRETSWQRFCRRSPKRTARGSRNAWTSGGKH